MLLAGRNTPKTSAGVSGGTRCEGMATGVGAMQLTFDNLGTQVARDARRNGRVRCSTRGIQKGGAQRHAAGISSTVDIGVARGLGEHKSPLPISSRSQLRVPFPGFIHMAGGEMELLDSRRIEARIYSERSRIWQSMLRLTGRDKGGREAQRARVGLQGGAEVRDKGGRKLDRILVATGGG